MFILILNRVYHEQRLAWIHMAVWYSADILHNTETLNWMVWTRRVCIEILTRDLGSHTLAANIIYKGTTPPNPIEGYRIWEQCTALICEFKGYAEKHICCLLIASSAYTSILKKEAVHSSETSINLHYTTLRSVGRRQEQVWSCNRIVD
jgi:hypothetical protein